MLDCYSSILSSKPASKFDSDTFRELCFTPLLQLMSLLAVQMSYTALEILYERFYNQLRAHFLAILIFIPEIELPSNYQCLIPTFTERCEPTSCSQNIHDELGEKEFYETHSGLIRFRNTLPTSVDSLREWFVFRTRQIDNISGQYNNAAWLIDYGIANCIPDLLQTRHDLWFLGVLVEDLGSNSGMIGLSEVEKLSGLQRIRVVLETVVVSNFFDRFKKYIEPILDFNETCSEGNKLLLMREFMLEIAQENLPLCQVIFKKSFVDKHCILESVAMIGLAMECIYACLTPAQLANAFSIFECIPRSEAEPVSELSEQLTQLEMVLKSASILQNYSIFLCPNEILNHQKGEEQEVRLLILRQAGKLANQRLFPPQRLWEQLLVDILSLKETVFPQLQKNTCYSLFSQTLMSSQCQESVRLASSLLRLDPSGLNRLSTEGYSSETWRCCLSFEESVNVVLQASQLYFNASSHFMDQQMQLARTCLQLIQPPTEAIQEELNLVAILSLLDDLKFDILPAQLRACENRFSLMKEAIDAKPENYRRKQKIEKLLTLLKIPTTPRQDGTVDCSEISISLAERAFFCEDWRTCEDYCYVLMRSHYPNAWEVCHRLGAVESFSNLSSRKNLLGYAIENCPVDRIESVLCSSTILTNQLLETATAQSTGSQVISKVSLIMGKALKTTGLNRFSYLTGFAQNSIEMDTEGIPNNPKQLSINKHSFYNSNTKFSLSTHLIASHAELFRSYSQLQGMSTIQDLLQEPNYLLTLNSYSLACLRAAMHYDSTLSIGYMMAMHNNDFTSSTIEELPQEPLILEFYVYYLALLICSQRITQHQVRSLLLMSPTDFLIDFEHTYSLFKHTLHSNSSLMLEFEGATRQLHILWEANILQEMEIDFDVDFYLADISYQNLIIRKVAQNSHTFDFALSIGEHHGISREVLFIEFLTYLLIQSKLEIHQLNYLFVEKGILDCLQKSPRTFAESLHTSIYPRIIGTNYDRLLACVELLGRCESVIGEPIHFIPNCLKSCVELTSLLTVLSQTVPLMDFKVYSVTDSIEILKEHLTIENIPKLSNVALLPVGNSITGSDLYFALCSQQIDSYNPSFDEIEVDNLSLISAMDHLSVELIMKLFKVCIFSTKALTLNSTQLQLKFQFICTAINQISSNIIKRELHMKLSLFSKHMHVCLSPPISSFPSVELKNEFFLSRSEPELVADILSRYLKSGISVHSILQVLTAASSVTQQTFDLASTFHDTVISLSYELQDNYSSHAQTPITSYSAYNIISTILESLSSHEMSSHSITPELISQLLRDILHSPDFSSEVKGFLSQLFQSSPLVETNGIDWSLVKLKIKAQIDMWWDYDVMSNELDLESNQVKLATDLLQLSTTEDHYLTLCVIMEFIPYSKQLLNEAWFFIMLSWSKTVLDFNRFLCRRATLEFNASQDDRIFKVLTSTGKIKSLLYLLVTQHKQLILAALDSYLPLLSEHSDFSMKNEIYELLILNDLTHLVMQSKLWDEFLTQFQQVSRFPLTELCCLVNRKSQLIPEDQKGIDIVCSQLYQAGFKLEATTIKINSSIPSRFLSFNSVVKWISQHDKL